MPLSLATKRRLVSAGVLAAVIVLGLFSRAVPLGWWPYDKSLGDILYAAAAYLALVLLLPRAPIWFVAVVATAACLAVEFLQLTEVNEDLLKVPVLRWFLGTTFSWHDVACYLLGIAVTVGVDAIFSLNRTLPSNDAPDFIENSPIVISDDGPLS